MIYSDMTSDLEITQGGTVKVIYDEDVVIQSIKTIIRTVSSERVRNPIGSTVLRLLFQPMRRDTAEDLRDSIIEVIQRYEPRVELTSFVVEANFEENSYDLSMAFNILGIPGTKYLRTSVRSFNT